MFFNLNSPLANKVFAALDNILYIRYVQIISVKSRKTDLKGNVKVYRSLYTLTLRDSFCTSLSFYFFSVHTDLLSATQWAAIFQGPFLLPIPEPFLPFHPGTLHGRTLYVIFLYVLFKGHVFNQLGLSVENTNSIFRLTENRAGWFPMGTK